MLIDCSYALFGGYSYIEGFMSIYGKQRIKYGKEQT
nr:MAG TPA: hypothetical protein [Caudoviricetes sp.]